MLKQQLERRQRAAAGEISRTAEEEDKEQKMRHDVLSAGFNPEVLQHRSDVQKMLMIKEEAPVDHRACDDLNEPTLHHIKEEEEGFDISLGAEQLKEEETDVIRFQIPASPIKTEDDDQSPLLSQLYPDQFESSVFPGEINGGEETEDTKKDKDDNDVKHPVSELKQLTDSGLKHEDIDSDWKESRAPESDGNIEKPFSSSEYAKQIVLCPLQKDMISSDKGSSSLLVSDKCFTEKKIINSPKKVQTKVKFSCDDCGKTIIRKHNFIMHERIHTGEKPFCCDQCGQQFSGKSNLNKHMRIHTGQKPFCCDQCGLRFRQNGDLSRHMRIHTGQKPFCCDQCGQKFSRKGNLNTHMRIHTGQKPFSCSHCGQRFRIKGHLKTHLRIHTGEKPFCCDQCGQSFSHKETLNTHMRIHTGQKPFRCDQCGYSFSHKSTLNTHIRIHTGEKPFCCDECGLRFSHKFSLNNHMKIHTGCEMTQL